MSVELLGRLNDCLKVRVDGVVQYPEWSASQRALLDTATADGVRKLYLDATGFAGWGKSSEWGDVGMVDAMDAAFDAIAVVGRPEWRDAMMAFALADLRQGQIAFFEDAGAALAWLAEH